MSTSYAYLSLPVWSLSVLKRVVSPLRSKRADRESDNAVTHPHRWAVCRHYCKESRRTGLINVYRVREFEKRIFSSLNLPLPQFHFDGTP